MNVRLHIERLVLDGLPVETAQAPALQAAVETELSRLLTERGLAPGLRQGGTLAYAPGGDLRLPAEPSPEGLGGQIARAIDEGIRR